MKPLPFHIIFLLTALISFQLIISSFLYAHPSPRENNNFLYQSEQIEDSLKNILAQATVQDSNYVMTLLRLSNHVGEQSPEQATVYAEEAVQISEHLSSTILKAKALNTLGICYLTEDRFAESLRSFIDAIPLFRKAKDGVSLGNGYNNASLVFKHLGDYPQSLAYLAKAEHIYDSVDYPIGIARANNNLGSLFRLQNDPLQAEKHYLKAFQIHTEMENDIGKSIVQLNLGLLYAEIKAFDKSHIFLDSALAYFTQNNIATSRVSTLIGLGELTLEEVDMREEGMISSNTYKRAEEYFLDALAEADRLGMPASKFSILNDLTKMKADQGKMVQSKQYAQQLKALADSINTPELQSRAEETLSYMYKKGGQWEAALEHYQLYNSWEDSIYNENTAALYKSQQVQMEVAQKDRVLEVQATQLASLNEQIILENRWKWTLAIASILLLIVGVLYYQKFRIRTAYSQQLESQNRLIKEQKEEIESINQRLQEQMAIRQETDDTINYFASSLFGKNSVDEILWDVAKNCISRLGLFDCVIYLVDEAQGKLIQKAAYGPKNPKDFEIYNPIEIPLGEGIVGNVALKSEAELINDTTQDERYILDDEARLSELAVPIIHQGKVIGVIDSEHPEKNFYTTYHLEALKTIVAICASKIAQAQADEDVRKSEKIRLEAEHIKAMDLMKSHFFANISHEFRTPLNLILGPLQTRGEHIPTQEIGMMQRNAQRLLRLVNQLMDLSKLEVGQLKLAYQQADVLAFLRNIAASFSSMADEKQIIYQIDIPSRKHLSRFDPDKLEKIVYNLLSNAIKFTPTGGIVSIHVAIESSQTLRLSVSDTGLGIPVELQSKIFDRFYQVDGSNTRSYEGTGIGLALTKELVDLHQGSITVDSEVEAGTSFVVILPLLPAEGEHTDEMPIPVAASEYPALHEDSEPIEGKSDLNTKDEPLILIVEDNPDLRSYIRKNLGSSFVCKEAEHGKYGWDMALEHVPDIIITDVMMPEMDGITLTKQIKNDKRTSHIPVIMLTARDDQETKRDGFHMGADQYVTKPFDVAELQERVYSLLRQRKLLQEKYGREIKIRPTDVTVNDHDAAFLERCIQVVEENMSDTEFGVDLLQREMGMSRMQLHRKLKALTNQSATEFIRNIRLQRAAQLLQQADVQVAEAAYDVGFNHLSYFAKCFKEKFGIAPSDYGKDKANLS